MGAGSSSVGHEPPLAVARSGNPAPALQSGVGLGQWLGVHSMVYSSWPVASSKPSPVISKP